MSYISVKDAVVLTGKSASTINRWCVKYEGTEHVKRQNRKFLISTAILDKLIANKHEATAQLVNSPEKTLSLMNSEEPMSRGIPLKDILKERLQKPENGSSSPYSVNQLWAENVNLRAQNKCLLAYLKMISDESQKSIIKSLEEKNRLLSIHLEKQSQQAESLEQQVINLQNRLQVRREGEIREVTSFFTQSFEKIQSILHNHTRQLNSLRTEQEQAYQLLPIPIKQETIEKSPAVEAEGFTPEDHKMMKFLIVLALILVLIIPVKEYIRMPFSIPYWQETREARLVLFSIISSWWSIKVWKYFKSDFRNAWRIIIFFSKV